MRGIVCALVTLTLALFGRPGQSSSDKAALEAKAKAFITQLAQGDAAGAIKRFGDPKKSEPSPESMTKGWGLVVLNNGAFERIADARFEKVETFGAERYRVVLLNCVFEHGKAAVRVRFDENGFVTGFHITKAG